MLPEPLLRESVQLFHALIRVYLLLRLSLSLTIIFHLGGVPDRIRSKKCNYGCLAAVLTNFKSYGHFKVYLKKGTENLKLLLHAPDITSNRKLEPNQKSDYLGAAIFSLLFFHTHFEYSLRLSKNQRAAKNQMPNFSKSFSR